MVSYYGKEVSNISISRIIIEFLFKSTRNFFKRIFYNYYLRGLSLASIELMLGAFLFFFGFGFGVYAWLESIQTNVHASTGTVMLAALPLILGLQLLLNFLSYDIASVPKSPQHLRLLRTIRRNITKDDQSP